MMSAESCILIGTDMPETRALAARLGATFTACPDDAGEAWRDAFEPRCADAVVLALWCPAPGPGALTATGFDDWTARCEDALSRWMIALGAASRACADNGAVVAVTEAPAPLDSAGWAPESAVAEGVAALVRSVAIAEGKRGVRANSVVTPCRLIAAPVVAPEPPLAGFPGTLDTDVASAVRLLLSPDAAHLTGHALPADRGRSW